METNRDNEDMIELQWMAARYAHDRRSYSTDTVNSITLRMIRSGIFPRPDRADIRSSPKPTVWVRDADFGWPTALIEQYGWDGRGDKENA